MLAARLTFLVDAEGTVCSVFHVGDDVTSQPGDVLAEAQRAGLTTAPAEESDGKPA